MPVALADSVKPKGHHGGADGKERRSGGPRRGDAAGVADGGEASGGRAVLDDGEVLDGLMCVWSWERGKRWRGREVRERRSRERERKKKTVLRAKQGKKERRENPERLLLFSFLASSMAQSFSFLSADARELVSLLEHQKVERKQSDQGQVEERREIKGRRKNRRWSSPLSPSLPLLSLLYQRNALSLTFIPG